MLVHSPKTEHHEGKDRRFVPIFPELRPYLERVFDQAQTGQEFVITHYRDARCNLRTRLQKTILRAGLGIWPKLFHNLRATRQTELMEHYPAHVVCAWLGNSQAIAAKHYLQVTEDHFEQGVTKVTAVQNAVQQRSELPRNGKYPLQPDSSAKKVTPQFPEGNEGLPNDTTDSELVLTGPIGR